MADSSSKKLILVIGATGAQGMYVIPEILAPNEDGTPSPYRVRALTRDPENRRAKELVSWGVELYKGSFYNLDDLAGAFDGCYGAFVNTDTYTVGAEREIYSGVIIYEAARRSKSMRHLIWSSLDYGSKFGNYNPIYKTAHYDGKGTVCEYLKAQESYLDDRLSWTSLTNGVYMEMLNYPLVGALNIRKDGTVVFASPCGDGHVPMIALKDLGWWTRYTLEHRKETSGKELFIASDVVGWDYLAETFTKVTGIPSVHKRLTVDEWLDCLRGTERPVANEKKLGDGSTTIRQSFGGFWCLFRDGILSRDMDWVKSIHPNTLTLDKWIKATGFNGKIGSDALKNAEDGKARLVLNKELCDAL